jgi:pyruvate dehydrogenase E1 component
MDNVTDVDPAEVAEWTDALDSVLAFEGPERANFILERLSEEAGRRGAPVPYSANTPYVNTIRPDQEARHPGDRTVEHRIRVRCRGRPRNRVFGRTILLRFDHAEWLRHPRTR